MADMGEINFFRHSADLRSIEPGEVLFREGETGDTMFAVVEGTLELSVNGHIIDEIEVGEVVGEMALIDQSPRSGTVCAKTTAVVAPVDRRYFVHLVQQHPTFALMVMEQMAERLRKANATSDPTG